jgi:hypothetical protein
MSEKPICLFCGKPLRKYAHSYETVPGTPVPLQVNGKKVVQVLRRKKSIRGEKVERLSLWCGEWGDYGDNFFCGLNCGYRWAVMRVKMSEKQEPGYVARFRDNMKKFQEAVR